MKASPHLSVGTYALHVLGIYTHMHRKFSVIVVSKHGHKYMCTHMVFTQISNTTMQALT